MKLFLLILFFAATGFAAVNAPTNLRTMPREFEDDGQIVCVWQWDANGETNWQFQCSLNGVDFTNKQSIAVAYYDQVRLNYRSELWVKVRAYQGADYSDWSTTSHVVGLYPVRDTEVSSVTNNTVTVVWTGDDSVEDGFKVYRDTNTNISTATLVATVSAGEGTCDDTYAFITNTVYYYWVARYCTSGNSERVDFGTISPNALPSPAMDSMAYLWGNTDTVRIRFAEDSNTEKGWRIDRSENVSNAWSTIKTYGINPAATEIYTEPFADTGLANTNYYRVVATNWQGDSVYELKVVFKPTSAPGGTTQWYVNPAAVGTDSGDSFDNAWRNLSSMNWESVGPGHTIHISGGTTTNIYREHLFPQNSGTSDHPITIRTATNSGHNGRVLIQGSYSMGASISYVTLDGSKDPDYPVPSVANIFDITNNINMEIVGVGTRLDGISIASIRGAKLRWIDVHGHGNNTHILPNGGVSFICDNAPRDCELAYSWVHENYGNLIKLQLSVGSGTADWDQVVTHHCLFQITGDNWVDAYGGFTFHDCRLENQMAVTIPGAHPDGFDIAPWKTKIFNCWMGFTSGDQFRIHLESAYSGNFYAWNNVFFGVDSAPGSAVQLTSDYFDTIIVTNVMFCNNLIYRRAASSFTWGKFPPVNHIYLTNWVVKNNVFIPITSTDPTEYGVSFGIAQFLESDVVLDYNLVALPAVRIYYNGQYTNAVDLNSRTAYTHNSTHIPAFSWATNFNFRLRPDDYVARNAGADLTTLGITNDLDGVARSGTWDIGPYEYNISTNLMLWLTFDATTNFTDGVIWDYSGNTNHGWRMSATNWPSATNGILDGQAAYWEDTKVKGAYGEGDYCAVTNLYQIASLTNGTVSVWANFGTNSYSLSQLVSAGDSWQDGGDSYTNSWGLGRNNDGTESNRVAFTIHYETGESNYWFPIDAGYQEATSSTNFHCYTATWNVSTGKVILYHDLVPWSTNTLGPADALKVGGGGVYQWIQVGCLSHGGTPGWFDGEPTEYPNHGWFGGIMDDVRIYNRDLSATEIAGLYSGSGTGGAAPAGGEAEPPAAPSILNINNVTIETLILR